MVHFSVHHAPTLTDRRSRRLSFWQQFWRFSRFYGQYLVTPIDQRRHL